jgi:aryl-alcohol dehydrogenase-like predicted oxidoreductase
MRLAMQIAALKDTDDEWQQEQRSVNARPDRYKYQLRHAFSLCARRLPLLEKEGVSLGVIALTFVLRRSSTPRSASLRLA